MKKNIRNNKTDIKKKERKNEMKKKRKMEKKMKKCIYYKSTLF